MPLGKKSFEVAHVPKIKRRGTDKRKTKQEELVQTWLYAKEDLINGVNIKLEYLGYEPVKEALGRQNAPEIIERLIHAYKGTPITVTVTANGLQVLDDTFDKDHPMKKISIYRISFTSTDKTRKRIFCFIAKDSRSGEFYLHCFQCRTRRQASEMVLTVAQAFQLAFEAFKKRDPEAKKLFDEAEIPKPPPEKNAAEPEEAQGGEEAEEEGKAEAEGEEEEEHNYEEIEEVKTKMKRKVSFIHRSRRAASAKEPMTSDEALDSKIEMPEKEFRAEFRRMSLHRKRPELPDIDVDMSDKTDKVAQFLAGRIAAEQITEEPVEEEDN
ncbi:low density lipoprotein receptor adapter protein 1-B-like [Oscarella lobularis]|uniref:low density lipoprotein receptor adapter protein 1-B-like n=1 Tax=Oscarella lobularis TaxID=121494 RepID=UPI0033137A9C